MKKKRIVRAMVSVIVILTVLVLLPTLMREFVYPLYYQQTIERNALYYKLDPLLVASVIREESRFDTEAKSNKSARGLMQLTDETAKWISGKLGYAEYNHPMLFEPEINIELGCWYLAYLIQNYEGDIHIAVAAYNAGEGNVKKWLADSRYSTDGKKLTAIPFKETEKYVKRVFDSLWWYKKLYAK